MVVGKVEPKTAKMAIVAGVSAKNLRLALFSAFLVCEVFDGSWGETFDECRAKTSHGQPEMNAVLARFGPLSHANWRNLDS